jgi:hypothetical protein
MPEEWFSPLIGLIGVILGVLATSFWKWLEQKEKYRDKTFEKTLVCYQTLYTFNQKLYEQINGNNTNVTILNSTSNVLKEYMNSNSLYIDETTRESTIGLYNDARNYSNNLTNLNVEATIINNSKDKLIASLNKNFEYIQKGAGVAYLPRISEEAAPQTPIIKKINNLSVQITTSFTFLLLCIWIILKQEININTWLYLIEPIIFIAIVIFLLILSKKGGKQDDKKAQILSVVIVIIFAITFVTVSKVYGNEYSIGLIILFALFSFLWFLFALIANCYIKKNPNNKIVILLSNNKLQDILGVITPVLFLLALLATFVQVWVEFNSIECWAWLILGLGVFICLIIFKIQVQQQGKNQIPTDEDNNK